MFKVEVSFQNGFKFEAYTLIKLAEDMNEVEVGRKCSCFLIPGDLYVFLGTWGNCFVTGCHCKDHTS